MALTTEYAQEYQQAVSAYMNCRYEEAKEITDRLAIGYPEEPNLMLLRGHVAACLQDLEAAKTHYKSVLTLTEDTELVDCANNSLLGIVQQQGGADGAAYQSAPHELSSWDSEGVTALQQDEQNGAATSEDSQLLDSQAFNLEMDPNVMNLSELEVAPEIGGGFEDLDPFSMADAGDNQVDNGADAWAEQNEAEHNLALASDPFADHSFDELSAANTDDLALDLDSLDFSTDDFNTTDLTADFGTPNLNELESAAVESPGEAGGYESLPTYRIELSELGKSLNGVTDQQDTDFDNFLDQANSVADASLSEQDQLDQISEGLGEGFSDESADDFAVLSLPVVDSEEALAFANNADFSFAEPDLGFSNEAITSELTPLTPGEFELDAFNPEVDFSIAEDFSSAADVQLPLRTDEPHPEQGFPADLTMGLAAEEDSALWSSEISGNLNWAETGLEEHPPLTDQSSLANPAPSLEPEEDDHSLFDLVGAGELPSAGQQPPLTAKDLDLSEDLDGGEDSLFGEYFDVPLPNIPDGFADESGVVDISYGITEQNSPSGESGLPSSGLDSLSLPDIDADDNNYSGGLSDWPYPASNSSGKTATFGLNTVGSEFDDNDLDAMGDATADLRMPASEASMPDLPRLDTSDLGAHLWENASEQFSFVNGSNSEVAAQPSGFAPSAIGSGGIDSALRPTAKANTSLDKQNQRNALITGAAAAVVGGIVALGSGMPQALPASILAGLAGGGATLFTGQRQVKKIKNATTDLQNQFSALIEGDFSAKANESEQGEFGDLAMGFNQMTRVVASVTGEARHKAEENQKSREDLQRQVIRLLDDVEGAARGDLTVQAEVSADVLGAVADSFNLTIHNLRKIVQQVKVAALQVNKGATENESFARTLSADALRQAEELAVTLNSVQMMTNAIQRVADSAKEANEVARMASDTALRGGEAVERTVFGILQIRETVAETTRKVKRLAESSQEISKIVNVIAQIASRTNLLALNASIEAARAGESGRGFAIVADEVRQLADRAAKASKEIEGIVLQIQSETGSVMTAMEEGTQQVIQGTKLAEQAKGALEDIIQVSSQIDRLVRSITNATVEQTETARSMAQVMQSVELTAQATSQEAQRVSNSLHQLATVSGDLQASVEKFKVEENQSL